MPHRVSIEDERFLHSVETCTIALKDFDHRAHLRLGYIYLVREDLESACNSVREALLRLLDHYQVDAAKFHVTLTRAWLMAIAAFMGNTADSESADAFLASNPQLLNTEIMDSHYSGRVLFSDRARETFVPPDLSPLSI